jgi:hypothetical protein
MYRSAWASLGARFSRRLTDFDTVDIACRGTIAKCEDVMSSIWATTADEVARAFD